MEAWWPDGEFSVRLHGLRVAALNLARGRPWRGAPAPWLPVGLRELCVATAEAPLPCGLQRPTLFFASIFYAILVIMHPYFTRF